MKFARDRVQFFLAISRFQGVQFQLADMANQVVQIHGGYCSTKDFPVERMMRDARITKIYEGTSEMRRLVIGTALTR